MLLIFDLDGTLIDSKLDLAHAVNATRLHAGLEPLDNELVYSYVGNGAPVLIRKALGPAYTDAALDYFLAYYREHMLDYTVLYPGVLETLDILLERGHPMAVLTNKPVRISEAIVEGLGMSRHFFRVYGGNSFEQKKPDPIGITTLMSEAPDGGGAMMVGDSAVDIKTARNAGIPSCGVTYGFQPETLTAEPPDYLIDRLPELTALLDRLA